MKRITSLLLAAVLAAGLFFFSPAETQAAQEKTEFRAVWVATVLNLDYPSKSGLSVAALKREADSILTNAQDMGFNAVILQVRPTGDALYNSSIFPWSEVLTGEQGKAPDGGFDPLAYFIEGAHSRGMELHAWLNPFRVARNTKNTDGLSADNPAKKNPGWTKTYTDGHLYYDPGVPEVRRLVLDGIREIVENYDVDGIHFDDYFYPGKDFSDDDTYKTYGGGYTDKDEWRRGNINALIKEAGEIVRGAGGSCRFGVAPQAIWANKSRNPLGSDTKGYETYYEQFADTRKWVLEGWVDYIAPQIYWEIGRESSDYSKVLAWWAELVTGTSVDLYVGHATYLMNGNSTRPAWAGTGEIARQLAENKFYPAVKGDIHFRYSLIAGDQDIATAVKSLYIDSAQQVSSVIDITMPAPPASTLAVGRPSGNMTFSGENFYIVGASDPNQKLTVNGTEITNRTPLGYFAYYATLKKGANTFTFAQGNNKVTRTITVPSGSGSGESATPPVMAEAAIEPGVFPEVYDEIRAPGSEVTLTCVAPIGAEVTVRVGGKTLAMKPDTTEQPSDGAIYSTTYRAVYTYPKAAVIGNAPSVTVGTPVYTMNMNGYAMSRAATGSLRMSTGSYRLVAEVTSDTAFVYPKASTTGGPVGELSRGQTDAVVSQQNATWVGLSCGLWVLRADVRMVVLDTELSGHVTGAVYQTSEKWDTFTVHTSAPTATSVTWNGKALTFTVFSSDAAPSAQLPADALIGRLDASFTGGKAVYTLTPAAGITVDGYYTEPVPEGLRLYIKRKPLAGAGDKPLDGFSIVLDAGHGGTDPGAPGPFGSQYAEKYINLYAELKLKRVLESYGAKVTITRPSDETTSLQSRLDANRAERPDLFISLHCNSMAYDVNSDNIRGVTVFYREAVSSPFAESIYNSVRTLLGVGGKGFHQSNLYVCRGFWTPSALIEMSFINNPYDYEWLTDDAEQNKLVTAIADSIVRYFR